MAYYRRSIVADFGFYTDEAHTRAVAVYESKTVQDLRTEIGASLEDCAFFHRNIIFKSFQQPKSINSCQK